MKSRQYAWQILHARIRHHVAADEGLGFPPQVRNIVAVLGQARADNIDLDDVVIDLAGLALTYAVLLRESGEDDLLQVAKLLEQRVMAEPDGGDDGDH
jgi:hypothetical protein